MNASGSSIDYRSDLIERLREGARRDVLLEELVRMVQDGHDASVGSVLPLLGYFTHAFGLPLYDVLPLREWVQDHDESRVKALRESIRCFGKTSEVHGTRYATSENP